MIWPIILYWWQISSFSSSTPLGPRDEIWVVFVPSHHIVHVWYTTKGWQRVTIVIWALQHVSNIETPPPLAHLFSLSKSLYQKKLTYIGIWIYLYLIWKKIILLTLGSTKYFWLHFFKLIFYYTQDVSEFEAKGWRAMQRRIRKYFVLY